MYTRTIQNPKTNRRNAVRCWSIAVRAIAAGLECGNIKSARDISWSLLNDDQSIQTMENEMGGDEVSGNFALSVFENALDWQLGVAVLQVLKAARPRMPKDFEVAVNRAGDVFVIFQSGKVWKM